jgi:hypothetical protein
LFTPEAQIHGAIILGLKAQWPCAQHQGDMARLASVTLARTLNIFASILEGSKYGLQQLQVDLSMPLLTAKSDNKVIRLLMMLQNMNPQIL